MYTIPPNFGGSPRLSPEHAPPVRDDPHAEAVDVPRAREHLLRAVRLELLERTLVEDHLEDRLHVEWLAVVAGQERVGLLRGARRFPRIDGGVRTEAGGESGDERADLLDAGVVVLHPVVRHAAHPVVHQRAAEFLRLDLLPRRSLHEVRAPEDP